MKIKAKRNARVGRKKGGIPWNKGLTKDTSPILKKIAEGKMGEKNPFYGKSHTGKTKKILAKKNRSVWLGKKRSVETKQKIGKTRIQRNIRPTEETKRKMRESHIGLCVREKHPNWQGGKSFKPYTIDWTVTLRRSIRERDHYTCQLCGELQGDRVLDVHHIDYDKKNCNPDNLITLCRGCHSKTGFDRQRWIKYFEAKVMIRNN